MGEYKIQNDMEGLTVHSNLCLVPLSFWGLMDGCASGLFLSHAIHNTHCFTAAGPSLQSLGLLSWDSGLLCHASLVT